MIIEVTQKHIDNGLKLDCNKCPVALALWDAGFDAVLVDIYLLFAESEFFYISEYSSRYIRDKILAFDGGAKILPFSFNVKIQNLTQIPNWMRYK